MSLPSKIENPKSKIENPPAAIVLAAGKGTRMNSDLPKVLHPVGGRPMVHWVLDACESIGSPRIVVVVGHRAELVQRELADRANLVYAQQTEQLGTGHAVRMAEHAARNGDATGDVLVLCGDGPLIRPSTLQRMIQTHRSTRAAATLATSVIPDPAGYGRILRDPHGDFLQIVEHKDATDQQRQVREINPSYYLFRTAELFDALSRVTNHNAKGEYYLTDVFGILRRDGKTVSVIEAVPPEDVLSINTPAELSVVDEVIRRRIAAHR